MQLIEQLVATFAPILIPSLLVNIYRAVMKRLFYYNFKLIFVNSKAMADIKSTKSYDYKKLKRKKKNL